MVAKPVVEAAEVTIKRLSSVDMFACWAQGKLNNMIPVITMIRYPKINTVEGWKLDIKR